MAPDIVSSRIETLRSTRSEWPQRISLTRRILAVNIFALAFLAGGFFYLDSYRARLVDGRLTATAREAGLVLAALDAEGPARRDALLVRSAHVTGFRLRLYGTDGTVRADSFALAEPTYRLIDPRTDPWTVRSARVLDRLVETVAFARRPPRVHEPEVDRLESWPEAVKALETGRTMTVYRFAPDRTPFLSAAVPIPGVGVLLATTNARDITEVVRAERLRIGLVILAAIVTSVLLSFFLARTIVEPLRRLSSAAVRVRLGRAREVIVPRLPERGDEIGLLARAVSDMSQALRQRIDATESFAADVSHELKNPIASLRSALEGMGRITDPELQAKLLAIAQDDVLRLDRLVTDIAESSRIDAQLSRTPFKSIDLAILMSRLVKAQSNRDGDSGATIELHRPRNGLALVLGDSARLAQVFDNLIDNARSFSPPGGVISVDIDMENSQGNVRVSVRDEGPGVPVRERENIFRRFHSVRPASEAFGRHSGLGLSIARTIVDGHNGTIHVEDRADGTQGASFVVILPRAQPQEDDEPNEAR
ncbi:ATP-binding protein [Sphingobium sp. CR28]|uniref:ATP-binding protein n=1 Tax=Sphingobium sp. CR28 TaxID=3400272 RepID=UPI003FEFC124